MVEKAAEPLLRLLHSPRKLKMQVSLARDKEYLANSPRLRASA